MSDSVTYRIEFDRNRAIVTLLPALNEAAWADIEKIGSDIVSQLGHLAVPLLLVDLTPLNYMGSAQVALVVRSYKAVKERGGKLVVANRHPLVLEVLTLAGLNKLWPIVDSRDAALKSLGGGGSSGEATSRTAVLMGGIGLAALAVSGVALVAIITQAAWWPARSAIALELATGGVAFLCGLLAVLKGSRTMGAGVLVASVAVLLAGMFSLGTMQQSPPESVPTTSSATNASPAGDAVMPAKSESGDVR